MSRMSQWNRRIGAVLLSAAMVLGVTACGGSGASGNKTEDALSRIKSAGKITIGTEGTYPPISYHDESGALVGFDVEVGRAVAAQLGVEAEFIEADWDSLVAGVQSGRFDIVTNEVTPTEERKKSVDFSHPYTFVYNVVITRKDDDSITQMEDLAGKKVSNTISSTHAQLAESYGAEIVAVNDFEASVEMVLQGRADATINSEMVFREYLKTKPDADLKIAAYDKEANMTAIPVRKGEESLRDAVNAAIKALQEDGTLSEISVRYFDQDITKQAP
ncbi:MAG: transporter substrate-binding domain-containing protein [Butyrivibrio sp.]|nr:transporter substrate-binding domain-containing protein [Butyrivibrio sp.]